MSEWFVLVQCMLLSSRTFKTFLSSKSTFCSLPLKHAHKPLSYKKKKTTPDTLKWIIVVFTKMKHIRKNQLYFSFSFSPLTLIHPQSNNTQFDPCLLTITLEGTFPITCSVKILYRCKAAVILHKITHYLASIQLTSPSKETADQSLTVVAPLGCCGKWPIQGQHLPH